MIYNFLFEQAQCKLLNVIEQTTSQIYEIIGDEILINIIKNQVDEKTHSKIIDALLNVIESHMMLTSKWPKPYSSGLTYILIKLL